MCTSYLIWYIVDGKTPGVIVLMFVFTFCEFYFILRYPRFVVITILAIVTQVLVVGYELQVQKVGLKVRLKTRTNNPYILTSRSRSQKAMDSLLIRCMSLLHTDLLVWLEACLSPSSGHSFRIHSRLARNFERISELPYICSPTTTHASTPPSEPVSMVPKATLTTKIASAEGSTRLVRRCSRRRWLCWLG